MRVYVLIQIFVLISCKCIFTTPTFMHPRQANKFEEERNRARAEASVLRNELAASKGIVPTQIQAHNEASELRERVGGINIHCCFESSTLRSGIRPVFMAHARTFSLLLSWKFTFSLGGGHIIAL